MEGGTAGDGGRAKGLVLRVGHGDGKHLKNPQIKEHNRLILFFLASFVWLFEAMRCLKYLFLDCSVPGSRNWIMSRTARNVRRYALSHKSTKEIFTSLYRELSL